MRTLPSAALVVSMLAALLARPGSATITVEGDQAFKDKVAAALKKIKDSDATKKAKIEALESSTHTHKIKKTDVPKGSNNGVEDPKSAKDATNGTGTGSVTQWEPNGTEKYDDDVNRDPTAALFHELVHACDKDMGKEGRKAVTGPDGDIDGDEVNAVTVENMYRMVAGLDLRGKYGGKRLPAVATTTTTTTTTQTSTTTVTTTSTTSPGCSSANLFVDPGNCIHVQSQPPGISCPTTCNAMFSTASTVQLFAQAPMAGFSGNCDPGGNVRLQEAQPQTGCALSCVCTAP